MKKVPYLAEQLEARNGAAAATAMLSPCWRHPSKKMENKSAQRNGNPWRMMTKLLIGTETLKEWWQACRNGMEKKCKYHWQLTILTTYLYYNQPCTPQWGSGIRQIMSRILPCLKTGWTLLPCLLPSCTTNWRRRSCHVGSLFFWIRYEDMEWFCTNLG